MLSEKDLLALNANCDSRMMGLNCSMLASHLMLYASNVKCETDVELCIAPVHDFQMFVSKEISTRSLAFSLCTSM